MLRGSQGDVSGFQTIAPCRDGLKNSHDESATSTSPFALGKGEIGNRRRVANKRGHSAFCRISRKLPKIFTRFCAHITNSVLHMHTDIRLSKLISYSGAIWRILTIPHFPPLRPICLAICSKRNEILRLGPLIVLIIIR